MGERRGAYRVVVEILRKKRTFKIQVYTRG
jgi:hypothetical protein